MTKKFKVFISVLCMCIMCSFTVFASSDNGYVLSADDFPGVKVSRETKGNLEFIPMDINENPTVTLSGDKMPRNQIGEPMDQMYFYYIYLYPIVRIPETGEVGTLGLPMAGAAQETRQYLTVRHTPAETAAVYQRVIEDGYDMLGWQAKVKFRFDFITPISWVRMINYVEAEAVDENVPQPHNPYQTYILTFNSYFQTNPLEKYTVSLSGDVRHFDKYDKKTERVPFNASVTLNTNQ